MPQKVDQYTLLISCPGDVSEEIELIKSAVEEFNELYAEHLGITIITRHWKTSAYAQSGNKPQALLNEQFVKKCDAAVAIFWTRFGSPTDEYASGTEEEIEIMLQSGKQVFMYFSDKPAPPSQMNGTEYTKIQEFREKYKDRGIYFTYSTTDEFRKLFFAHLSMYFLTVQKANEMTEKRHSKLQLLGIDECGKLSEQAHICDFKLNTTTSKQGYSEMIYSMYKDIAAIYVGDRLTVETGILAAFSSPVDINKEEQELLRHIAKHLEITLPEDFFSLGNLEKDNFSSNALFGINLKGTPEEKEKYQKIKKLLEVINEAAKWGPIEDVFSGKSCLKLAIQNCGNAVDEDVEITLEFSQEELVTLDGFPQLTNEQMGYLLNERDMEILFGIESTAEYLDYAASEQHPRNSTYINGLPGYPHDYSDDFISELKNVFYYSIYQSGAKYIVKLKVDYIKHNTTVAFPSVLFIKGEIEEIPYKITSRNNPDIVEGILQVQSKPKLEGQ